VQLARASCGKRKGHLRFYRHEACILPLAAELTIGSHTPP
jgi:hypothetical protein